MHWIIHLFFRLLNSLSIFMSGLYICHPVQHRRLQDVLFSVHHRHGKIHGSPVRLLLEWRKRRNKGRKEKKRKKQNKQTNKEEGKEREREKKKTIKERGIHYLWEPFSPRAFGRKLPMLIWWGYLRFSIPPFAGSDNMLT